MAAKRSRKTMKRLPEEDRLSNMPESLQLLVLSCLDTRHAVQTSVLSKSWASSWTCIPVLNFSSYGFKEEGHVFDNFVENALSRRQSVKLDKLTFKHHERCNVKTFEKVFDYAFSHGVKEVEANVKRPPNKQGWPIRSSDSLTSLKLESFSLTGCPFLEPRWVGSFKNVTSLHLKCVHITDPDPFSRFPALQKLKLVGCYLETGGALNVYAPLLSELTLFYYYTPDCYRFELTTPKLRYFEWLGSGFPRLTTKGGGLPVLDTAVIYYNGYRLHIEVENKRRFDDMLKSFNTVCAARSLTVSAPTVHLLTFFPDELANRCSPFQDLKSLKLDFSFFCNRTSKKPGPCRLLLSETLELVPCVKAYLLNKSHGAKFSLIKDPNAKSPCPTSHTSQKCMCNMDTSTQI